MLMRWPLAWLGVLLQPDSAATRPLRDFTRFDLGVCPGCRGLRAVASLECTTCGNTAAVKPDA